jgi:hypothetical protein
MVKPVKEPKKPSTNRYSLTFLSANNSGRFQRFKVKFDKPDQDNHHQMNARKDIGLMQEESKDIVYNQVRDAAKFQHIDGYQKDEYSKSSKANNRDEEVEILDNKMEIEEVEILDNKMEIDEAVNPPQPISEESNFIPVLQDDEKDITKNVTMTDFAGQCAYYASHQIFLSPRSFFLLVLNMKKNLDDVVDGEVCCQKGSVYGEWTFRGKFFFFMGSNSFIL